MRAVAPTYAATSASCCVTNGETTTTPTPVKQRALALERRPSTISSNFKSVKYLWLLSLQVPSDYTAVGASFSRADLPKMALQPSASIANLLRDPAERHPQKTYVNGVLQHNWWEDRYTGHIKETSGRAVLPQVSTPQFETTTGSNNESMVATKKTYVPPPMHTHTEPYSNVSLMDNWFEDRFTRPLAGQTQQRTTSPTLRNRQEQLKVLRTTKDIFDHRTVHGPGINKPPAPSFVTLRNVSQQSGMPRSTMTAPARGFGATLPSHPADEGAADVAFAKLGNSMMHLLVLLVRPSGYNQHAYEY